VDFLPLFFKLENKACLLVGGGSIALRKARLLKQAGAIIYVVSPKIDPELLALVEASKGSYRCGKYQIDDLADVFLVVAATDNTPLNQLVSEHANERQLPVNVVDSPDLCSVILPAIIDRSPIVIAVSSGGQSPVLARLLRTKIESLVPAAYGQLGQLVGSFREQVKQRFSQLDDRKNFWESVLHGPIAEMVLSGKPKVAEQLLSQRLSEQTDPLASVGEVYLVGAGPGDPDLLTFKALRLMQQADVVLYDRLVSDAIVDLTRRDAERIYVGKKQADHAMPQKDINQLLVDFAKQGKKVLRLKGGDPFIFGRGSEEIEELAEHKIPFQVVPGITAASGCAAYSGIPLTHRDYAQSVRFIAGHLKDGTSDLPWSELAYGKQTLVFYMGLVGLPIICRELIAHGLSPATPMALIQQGTTPNQRVIIGNLQNMPEKVILEQVRAPTLLIVGDVVKLREKLAWFENMPEDN
jgi:uroporphyrin-III C-methyltransferase/precorrin-2 dehydrogenase/sirohydrochlorin ferrochelatase